MNLDDWADINSHRRLSEDLHETPWWQSLMNDPGFHAAYERNYHARLKLADSRYLKKLMRSEKERQAFVEGVWHPQPEHVNTWDDE